LVEKVLDTLLSSSTAITAITPRIYPLLLPNDPTLPAVEYRFVGASSKPTFDTHGITTYRAEINCWGASYADAVSLRDAVKNTLSGYTDGTTTIQFLSQMDLFDEDLLQYRAVCEFYLISSL
jgi:hypothetical protein